jgi:predicted DsbA family dithiol-disulfide isomerase
MLHIDIWADFACPACYLARPRIDQAIAASGHAGAITVTYRSLELFPDAGSAFLSSGFRAGASFAFNLKQHAGAKKWVSKLTEWRSRGPWIWVRPAVMGTAVPA